MHWIRMHERNIAPCRGSITHGWLFVAAAGFLGYASLLAHLRASLLLPNCRFPLGM